MSGVAPDPLDRIAEEFDVHGTLETRHVLALLEIARAARDFQAHVLLDHDTLTGEDVARVIALDVALIPFRLEQPA